MLAGARAWWRRTASRAMNRLRERLTRITMTDQGCMLRAYRRDIVEAIVSSVASRLRSDSNSPPRPVPPGDGVSMVNGVLPAGR